jgi:Holliday junction DNA helicase RuvA
VDRGGAPSVVIAHLRGELVQAGPQEAVIDVGGVGYVVQLTRRAREGLPPPGGIARLPVRMIVREDGAFLYGFADAAEREAFDRLIGVAGVGPRLAVAVLGDFTPSALRHAVAAADRARVTRVPGVGNKTAERLILELRDWAGSEQGAEAAAPVASATDGDDLQPFLQAMGFTAAEARAALALARARAAAGADDATVVRAALAHLAPARGVTLEVAPDA